VLFRSGAALYEEYAYDDQGVFLAGTFADYPMPTVHEVPALDILHISTPSPLTPLGAKGVGEGNCMSTPVCIANAVADALAPALGVVDLTLPLTPARLAPLLGQEPEAPAGTAPEKPKIGRGMTGSGQAQVQATPQEVWDLLLDADQLAAIIPGAHGVRKLSPTRFLADVTLGVGPVKGCYKVDVALSDLDPPHSALLGALTPEEVDRHCHSSGLANFKRPRRVIFVAELPKSPVGKLLRRHLVSGDYLPEPDHATKHAAKHTTE